MTLGSLCIKPIFLLYGLAHITLLLVFVALYTGLGRHLETLGVAASGIVWVRLAAFPAMLISLYAGSYAKKYGVLRVAQLGYVLSVLGLLGGVLCAQVLAGIVICSLIYVAGVALAIPSMITLYGDAAAPHRASGMALNGFVLFVGASLGACYRRVTLSIHHSHAFAGGLPNSGFAFTRGCFANKQSASLRRIMILRPCRSLKLWGSTA